MVNGVKLKFGLDTGAELNLLDVKAKRKVLENFEPGKRVLLSGASQKKVEMIAGVLHGVELGITQGLGMRTLLTGMWEVNQAMGTDLDGMLGYEFLFNKRLSINYKRKMIYFFEPLRS